MIAIPTALDYNRTYEDLAIWKLLLQGPIEISFWTCMVELFKPNKYLVLR
jgi:hypothetical protein